MKVGDYIRTNDGYINKIKKVNKWNVLVDARYLYEEEIIIANNEIIKSSPNIIDLIEVGDYVNGYKVLNVLDFNDNSKMLSLEKIYDNKIASENIKSIVTKEQFESMEYKLGE